jgi:hypothetical protein
MSETKKFSCTVCQFSTISNSNLQKHFLCKKHIRKSGTTDIIVTDFQCQKCQKYYVALSGLWKHNKVCKFLNEIETSKENESILVTESQSTANQEIIEEIRKMNETTKEEIRNMNEQNLKEVKNLISDLKDSQQLTTTINNTNNNNTTINNTFNMSVFLNETCNKAINFEQFIKNLVFEHADSKLMIDSYVEGTCNIIQRNLEELPINQRPLHYLAGEDPHQQLMHIRQDDKWNIGTQLNWMQQIHADDDDDVVEKNPIYYALQEIDQEKLKYLGYYFNQDKSYMLQHGRLHREITRPDFKEKVYQLLLKLITLDTDKLDGVDVKRKIEI